MLLMQTRQALKHRNGCRISSRKHYWINNTAQGYNALNANTTGAQNTAMGVGSLAANTTGSITPLKAIMLLMQTRQALKTLQWVSDSAANTTG